MVFEYKYIYNVTNLKLNQNLIDSKTFHIINGDAYYSK